jgi:hypothetical protein
LAAGLVRQATYWLDEVASETLDPGRLLESVEEGRVGLVLVVAEATPIELSALGTLDHAFRLVVSTRLKIGV